MSFVSERLPQLLICDDDATFQLALKQFLKGKFQCRSAYNADEALIILKNHAIDVLLLDVQMRSADEGLRSIPKFLAIDPELTIVMSSGVTDFNVVREAMKQGAADYIVKSSAPDELLHSLNRVFEKRSLQKRSEQKGFEAESIQRQHVLVGQSPSMQRLRKLIDRFRASTANVVITGETGTGKEVVARQLRKRLPDGSLEPFVAVDSATIQSTTAESILFGYEKGAFTGADRSAKGLFEEAHGGVIYFDELGNMPLEIQAKLLRVIQEKEVLRLGSAKPIQLEFRVICATNRDLNQWAAAGRFKDDLLQRLAVLPIELEPLRARSEDIPELVEYFLRKQGEVATQSSPLHFSSDALDCLKAHSWPGNIRELANVVSYVAAIRDPELDGSEIEVADLPPQFRAQPRPQSSAAVEAVPANAGGAVAQCFYDRVAAFEKQILSAAYSESGGNMSRLAASLEMDRSHLYKKLREHGIHLPVARASQAGAAIGDTHSVGDRLQAADGKQLIQ